MVPQKILVVDDEPCIRKAFTNIFRTAGYAVQSAESAEQALEIMHKTPAPVLFLDLNLPGMNGLDLCREVRKSWPWCIAIAVTGYASLFELVTCREAGFEDYFIKPMKSKELLTAAEQAFGKFERWKKRPTWWVAETFKGSRCVSAKRDGGAPCFENCMGRLRVSGPPK
jgi:CheY-like chemotaxis protein